MTQETVERYKEFLCEVQKLQLEGRNVNQDVFTKHKVGKIRRDLIPYLVNVEITDDVAKRMVNVVNSYTNNRHTVGYLMGIIREIESSSSPKEDIIEQSLPTETLVKELQRRGYKVTLSV